MGQLIFVVNSALSSGAGDVVGPGSAVSNDVVAFDGITGQLIKDSGIPAAAFVGDSGAGGVIGFVPAPAAGDAANFRYLNANGTWEQLSEDQILPGFAISSFTKSAASLVRRGAGVGANSTVSILYTSGPPASASLSNVNTGAVGGGLAPAAWTGLVGPAFSGATQPNNVAYDGADGAADPVWTINLSATKPPTKTASLTVQWTRDVYFGVGAPGLTVPQIQALTSALDPTKNRTITVSPVGQKVYYAFPQDYGLATFTLNGFPAAFTLTAGVPFTSLTGLVSLYNVYESNNLLTGVGLNFVVT
jgi:hypothetical protein